MKLWKLYQDKVGGYDTYDSAIVAAETVEDARLIYPDDCQPTEWPDKVHEHFPSWTTPEHISVTYLGEAAHNISPGVILASFNAG